MISPLAYVDPAAKLGKNVTVQPFAYIEADVEIGDDNVIMSGARILNGTRMGKGNKIYHGAVLAAEPQDFHYEGEKSLLVIGDHNDIRENVVISRATHKDGCTRIGNENHLMDGVHLCHDVQIGNRSVLGIKVSVAGDCRIDDCTILRNAYRLVYQGNFSVQDALQKIEDQVPMSDEIYNIINFIKNSNGIVK